MDYRSTKGYCTFLGGNLVTWRSKKHSLISKSSTEAEFRAMSKGIDEVMWIRNLLDEQKISYIKPIDIRCDNKSAICIAHDPVYHDRMKHVNIDRLYIQDHLEQCIWKTKHVSSEGYEASHFQAWNAKYTLLRLRGSVNYGSQGNGSEESSYPIHS